jgi:hypothetical protein
MPKRFDPARPLEVSTLRFGKFRARGIGAILVGSAIIVAAAGAARVLAAAAPSLPDTIRELKSLIETVGDQRKQLKP